MFIRTREERDRAKRDKKLDRSITVMRQGPARRAGIMAIQNDYGVFMLDGKFAKAYSINGLLEKELKRLVKRLNELLAYKRYRITKFSEMRSTSYFLTVYFVGSRLSEVVGEMERVEGEILGFGREGFVATLKPLGIDEMFEIMRIPFRESADDEPFLEVKEKEGEAWFSIMKTGQVGSALMGISFPSFPLEIKNVEIGELDDTARHSCLDIHVMDDEILETYHSLSGEAYNVKAEPRNGRFANVSYACCIFRSDSESVKTDRKRIEDVLSGNKLVVAPCNGIAENVVWSVASLGLVDFHAMRRVHTDCVPQILKML